MIMKRRRKVMMMICKMDDDDDGENDDYVRDAMMMMTTMMRWTTTGRSSKRVPAVAESSAQANLLIWPSCWEIHALAAVIIIIIISIFIIISVITFVIVAVIITINHHQHQSHVKIIANLFIWPSCWEIHALPAVTTIISVIIFVVSGVIRILDILFTLKSKYQHTPRHRSHFLLFHLHPVKQPQWQGACAAGLLDFNLILLPEALSNLLISWWNIHSAECVPIIAAESYHKLSRLIMLPINQPHPSIIPPNRLWHWPHMATTKLWVKECKNPQDSVILTMNGLDVGCIEPHTTSWPRRLHSHEKDFWRLEELFVWIFSNFPPSFIPSPHPSSPPGAIKREQAAERKVPP